ncbi:hypothetical protein HYW36_00855 [Candidatus Saccharibacteria bacterium]|nr:hypothetical protein [Candidatus Saccharibacteria bacterium]
MVQVLPQKAQVYGLPWQLAVWPETVTPAAVRPAVVLAQNRKSPDTARLLARVSYTTVARWYSRFRTNLPSSAKAVLAEVVISDESYFGKLRSKQDQVIVAGAIALDNQLKLQAIANRSAEVLTSFVSEAV